MNSRPWNPRRLDVDLFARESALLQGAWPLSELDRLADAAHTGIPLDADAAAAWNVRGESRAARSAPRQCWLHLAAQVELPLVCQRCLGPVETLMVAERSFLFVSGEDAAAELDAETEDDVLAMTRALDLRTLVEDELLLALPLVPRHEVCPEPLTTPEDGEEEAEERRQPFAALAAFKRGGPVS